MAGPLLIGSVVAGVLAWYALARRRLKEKRTVAIIVDNGSYRPASTLSLRDMARRVGIMVNIEVIPSSASFSDQVPADQLNDIPAEVLTTSIRRLIADENVDRIVFLPAFLGPSYVLHKVIPQKMTEVVSALGLAAADVKYHVARPLVDVRDSSDTRIATVLVDNILTAAKNASFTDIAVAVCDHGSPSATVSAVRDHIARQVQGLLPTAAAVLGITVRAVRACSMERRPEPEYDFNDPLLTSLLLTPPFDKGQVVLGLLFLSPGKHAGAGGDISEMIQEAVQEAEKAGRSLQCVKSTLLGVHSGTIEVLADRLREGLQLL